MNARGSGGVTGPAIPNPFSKIVVCALVDGTSVKLNSDVQVAGSLQINWKKDVARVTTVKDLKGVIYELGSVVRGLNIAVDEHPHVIRASCETVRPSCENLWHHSRKLRGRAIHGLRAELENKFAGR